MKADVSPAKQLTMFLSRFSPDIIALAKAARAKLRKRLPGAVEMVYDNYNALVIGYSPTERPSDAIAFGETPFRGKGLLVIRSISKKQRPRR